MDFGLAVAIFTPYVACCIVTAGLLFEYFKELKKTVIDFDSDDLAVLKAMGFLAGLAIVIQPFGLVAVCLIVRKDGKKKLQPSK